MAGWDLHRGLIGLHGNEGLVFRDRVAHRHQQLDHRDFVEVADVGHIHLNHRHVFVLRSVRRLSVQRIDFFRVDTVFLNGICDRLYGHCALIGKRLECRYHDVVTVDFEVFTQT